MPAAMDRAKAIEDYRQMESQYKAISAALQTLPPGGPEHKQLTMARDECRLALRHLTAQLFPARAEGLERMLNQLLRHAFVNTLLHFIYNHREIRDILRNLRQKQGLSLSDVVSLFKGTFSPKKFQNASLRIGHNADKTTLQKRQQAVDLILTHTPHVVFVLRAAHYALIENNVYEQDYEWIFDADDAADAALTFPKVCDFRYYDHENLRRKLQKARQLPFNVLIEGLQRYCNARKALQTVADEATIPSPSMEEEEDAIYGF